MVTYRALNPIKNSSGVTVGYILINDNTGNPDRIQSKDIKRAINNKSIKVFNLKITDDGKLIHVPSMDIIGKSVAPEQFFNNKIGNWVLEHATNSTNKVRATHSSGKKFILCYQHVVTEYYASYNITLDNDEALGTKYQYNENIFVDRMDTVEKLEEALNKLLSRNLDTEKVKESHTKNMVRLYELSHWHKKSLEDEYNHGCSEDSEKAHAELEHMNRLEEIYGNRPEYKQLLDKIKDMDNAEKMNYFRELTMDKVRKQQMQNEKKQKGTPSPWPGIIYESSARTASEWFNSLEFKTSNGIHAHNSMEYWWSLDPQEREAEVHDPNSPWYNFQ